MHKSKVAQNPKICRKPVEFFDLSILCALKVHLFDFYDFLRIKITIFTGHFRVLLIKNFGGYAKIKIGST